jgi:hypothetical protein
MWGKFCWLHKRRDHDWLALGSGRLAGSSSIKIICERFEMDTSNHCSYLCGGLNGARQPQGGPIYCEFCGHSFTCGCWVGSPSCYIWPLPLDTSLFQPNPISEPQIGPAQPPSSTDFGVSQSGSQNILREPGDAYSISNSAPLAAGTWLPASNLVTRRGDLFQRFENCLGIAQSPTCTQFAKIHDLQAISHPIPNPQVPFPPPPTVLHPMSLNGEMRLSIHAPPAASGDIPQDRPFTQLSPIQPNRPQRTRRASRSQQSPPYRRATTTNRATSASQQLYCTIPTCDYTKPFARKADLDRHVVTQHEHDLPFKRKLFVCPWVACGMRFLRGDKMLQHQDKVHKSRIP